MQWIVGLLSVAAIASAAMATATALPSSSPNSSSPVPSNVSHTTLQWLSCTRPLDGLASWYYKNRNDGPVGCYEPVADDVNRWAMLNAYRSGGTEGVHWKYTDDVNDRACLVNWKYYAADGTTLYATIRGSTTTERDPRRWCALPVYRSGGVENKQWAKCTCKSLD